MSNLNINNNSLVCLCGKEKQKLNDTNWKRHISSCKISKMSKTCNPVSSYFLKKRESSEVTVHEMQTPKSKL